MEDLFVCNKTQAKLKLVKVNLFLIWIVWIMTTTKVLGLLNFSQALENSIWIAQRTIGIAQRAIGEMCRLVTLGSYAFSQLFQITKYENSILKITHIHVKMEIDLHCSWFQSQIHKYRWFKCFLFIGNKKIESTFSKSPKMSMGTFIL